ASTREPPGIGRSSTASASSTGDPRGRRPGAGAATGVALPFGLALVEAAAVAARAGGPFGCAASGGTPQAESATAPQSTRLLRLVRRMPPRPYHLQTKGK